MSIPVIYTDHLVLRPLEEGDVEALHRLWADPDVRRYLFDDILIPLSSATEIVHTTTEWSATTGLEFWAICRHAGAPLVGFCGFRRADDTAEVELLYGLTAECRGQGLATEACIAALSYFWATSSCSRVYARTDPPNQKSIAVMERLGMCYLGVQHGSQSQPLVTYALDRPKHILN
jgi:ribosomal-protein-alanine N-acetyltransferase